VLIEEDSGLRVQHVSGLKQGMRYRSRPARAVEPSVSNITIVVHSDGVHTHTEDVFSELSQSKLDQLLGLWGASGLQISPTSPQKLWKVTELSSNGTYHAIPVRMSLTSRVSMFACCSGIRKALQVNIRIVFCCLHSSYYTSVLMPSFLQSSWM